MAGSKASICGQSCCGAIARSLIEPEGFEGERPWVKGVAWGCQEICTGCTDFGRFQLGPSRRGRSARLTGMLGLSGGFTVIDLNSSDLIDREQ